MQQQQAPTQSDDKERKEVIDDITSASVAHFEYSLGMQQRKKWTLKQHLEYAANTGIQYFPRKSAIDRYNIKTADIVANLKEWGS